MKDLTKGPITKQLLTLALPLMIGNVLQQFYNTIDALVVGRYVGTEAFAAIGIAGTVMNLFIFILSGGCTGVGIIWAQFYGSRDWQLFRREGFLALAAGGIFTIAVSLLGILGMDLLLTLIATPGSIFQLVKDYLNIIFGGLLLTFLYNYCSTLLRSVGNTAMALFFLTIAMIINLILDIIFVAVLEWGISGAAWATIIAQGISVLLCYLYMKTKTPELLWNSSDVQMDKGLLQRTCNYALVTAMHNSNLYIGKLLVQGSINACGVDMVAAFTAAGRLEGFANSVGDSGTAAVNVFVAQNTGADNTKRTKQGFYHGMRLCLIIGALWSVILYFGAPQGIALMLGDTSGLSYEQGVTYLQAVALFYCLNFAGNALAGYFEGCGQLMIPTIGATGHVTIRVILCYLFVAHYGLVSVAYATGFGWFCVVCFWSYLIYSKLKTQRMC